MPIIKKRILFGLIVFFSISITLINTPGFSEDKQPVIPKVLRIDNDTISADLSCPETVFPKYSTQLMNIANQNAQGTRPKVVGQLSDLIQEFPGNSYEEWCKWYETKHPKAMEEATKKIHEKLQEMKKALELINEEMIRKWVNDLVLTKTYIGLRLQKSILINIAKETGKSFRLSLADEESKGIDGYIGDTPVSIMPVSYKSKNMLPEEIKVKHIYYEKGKKGIIVYHDF